MGCLPNRSKVLGLPIATLCSCLTLIGCGQTAPSAQGETSQAANPSLPPAPPNAVGRVIESRVRNVGRKAGSPNYQMTLQPGWSLFSVPFSSLTTFSAEPAASVLSCFSYNPTAGAYVAQAFDEATFAGAASPYQGYWVFCNAPVQLTLNGTQNAAAPTNLSAGWNLVGPPQSSDMSTSALTFGSESLAAAAAAGLTGSSAYLYSPASGNYQAISDSTGILPAFGAAWVFAFQSGQLSTTIAVPAAFTSLYANVSTDLNQFTANVTAAYPNPLQTTRVYADLLDANASSMYTVLAGASAATVNTSAKNAIASAADMQARFGIQGVRPGLIRAHASFATRSRASPDGRTTLVDAGIAVNSVALLPGSRKPGQSHRRDVAAEPQPVGRRDAPTDRDGDGINRRCR